jgi:hypothetical protein
MAPQLRLRDALPIWWQVARPWFVGEFHQQALSALDLLTSLPHRRLSLSYDTD